MNIFICIYILLYNVMCMYLYIYIYIFVALCTPQHQDGRNVGQIHAKINHVSKAIYSRRHSTRIQT